MTGTGRKVGSVWRVVLARSVGTADGLDAVQLDFFHRGIHSGPQVPQSDAGCELDHLNVVQGFAQLAAPTSSRTGGVSLIDSAYSRIRVDISAHRRAALPTAGGADAA